MGGVGSGVRKDKWPLALRVSFLRGYLGNGPAMSNHKPLREAYQRNTQCRGDIQLARDLDHMYDEGILTRHRNGRNSGPYIYRFKPGAPSK